MGDYDLVSELCDICVTLLRIEERRAEAETASTRIAELQAAAQEASDRLAAAREKLSAITGNSLYKLLPSWVRELLDGLLG